MLELVNLSFKVNDDGDIEVSTKDSKNKSLKLTSLNRDTYVDIPGHSTEKLTHFLEYIVMYVDKIQKTVTVASLSNNNLEKKLIDSK